MDKNGKFWRKAISDRRKAVAASDTSSDSEPETSLLSKKCQSQSRFCCNCCTCNEELQGSEKQKLKRKSSLLSSRSEIKGSVNVPYREQLETKILNEEMNEQMSYDKHNNSKKQIQDLSTLIRCFSSYIHSLDIRYRASNRLQKLLSEIVASKDLAQRTKESSIISVSKKVKEVLSTCYKNIELPQNYYEGCNDYSEKYKDHAEATLNFYYLLQNDKLPNSEMRRLDVEYDKMKNEFIETKTTIASQMSAIINEKSEVIEICIQRILPLLNEMMEQDRDIYTMLRSFSAENLSSNPEKSSSSRSLTDKCSKTPRRKSELGIRCKNVHCSSEVVNADD